MSPLTPFSLSDEQLDGLFRQARTHRAWTPEPVSDETLRRLYDLMKWGPTSANICPARIAFLRTQESKERLRPALSPNNVDKTMSAPVTAIVGYDLSFFEKLEKLVPQNPAIAQRFAASPAVAEVTAFRNGKRFEGATGAARRTDDGYDVEIAVPIEYITSVQPADWHSVQATVIVHDQDETGGPKCAVVWRGTEAFANRNTNYGQFATAP